MDEEESQQPTTPSLPTAPVKGKIDPKMIAAVIFCIIILIVALGIGFGMMRNDPGEPSPSSSSGNITCNDWTNAPAGYQSIFTSAANKSGIQPALLGSIFRQEHGNNWATAPWATSEVGASGPFQFMPGTWDGYKSGCGTEDVNNLEDAACGAAKYLAAIMKNEVHTSADSTAEQDIKDAAVAYTSSPKYFKKWRDGGRKDSDLNSRYLSYHTNVWTYFQELNSGCSSSTAGSSGNLPAPFFIDKSPSTWLGDKNVKGKMTVSGVVLHWTAGDSVESAINAMTSRHSFVHLIIDKDGKVYQLLPLDVQVGSGSGDGNTFAIGIEIVSTASNSIDANEQALLNNTTQYNAVIKTVKYLIDTYKIPNVKGNTQNLKDKRGIFGHLQTQGPWSKGFVKGCKGRKSDPGKTYLNKVWNELKSEGTSCI